MWLWYNTQLIRDKELVLSVSNRAFQYGDGIFETIIIHKGKIRHAHYHEARMKMGLSTLKLNLDLSFGEVERRIDFLLKKNKLSDARAKVLIYRKEGGFYIPETNEAEYLITVKSYKKPDLRPQKLDFSREVQLGKSISGNCKTLNALPYIMAGIELTQKKAIDDLILLDYDGNVSECISSNIFWVKDKTYYTPSLETNCVAGVQRAFILDQLKQKNLPVSEVKAGRDELLDADAVFKTNVTGVFSVSSIGNQDYALGRYSFPFEV